jgi:hypothetical protein
MRIRQNYTDPTGSGVRNTGVAYPVGVVLAHEAAYVVRALHQQTGVTDLLLLWVT